MAEYIERTKEIMLAMNAGARAIENTKRYHGAVYNKNVFSEDLQEIPYLQAAKVLREASDAPAADVAEVVRCRDCRYHGCGVCSYLAAAVLPQWFCWNGERDGGADREDD